MSCTCLLPVVTYEFKPTKVIQGHSYLHKLKSDFLLVVNYDLSSISSHSPFPRYSDFELFTYEQDPSHFVVKLITRNAEALRCFGVKTARYQLKSFCHFTNRRRQTTYYHNSRTLQIAIATFGEKLEKCGSIVTVYKLNNSHSLVQGVNIYCFIL